MSLFADGLRDPLGRHIILNRLWRGESSLSKSLGCDLVSHDHWVRVLLQLGACIFRVLLWGNPLVNKIILPLCGRLRRGIWQVYNLFFCSFSLKRHVYLLCLVVHGHLQYLLRLNWSSDPLNGYRVICGQINLSMHPEWGVAVTVREVCINLVGRRYIIALLQMTHQWRPIADEVNLEGRRLILVDLPSSVLCGDHIRLGLRQQVVQVQMWCPLSRVRGCVWKLLRTAWFHHFFSKLLSFIF